MAVHWLGGEACLRDDIPASQDTSQHCIVRVRSFNACIIAMCRIPVSLPQKEEQTASQAILKAGYIDVIIHSQRCKRQICPAHQQGPQWKAQLGQTIPHMYAMVSAKRLKGRTYRST